MSIASQLYQLQEFDIDLDSSEKALELATRQLADRSALNEGQGRLDAARQRLQELTKQQRGQETEIEDIAAKLKPIELKLYSGQVRNPKELGDLQREAEALKRQQAQLEDKELETMEKSEHASKDISSHESGLKKAEAEWQGRQVTLKAEIEALNAKLANLKERRQILLAGIDLQAAAVYQDVKKKRGTAVARVERGLCTGCRIALPVNEFQKARSGALVRCGSCGRILYLA